MRPIWKRNFKDWITPHVMDVFRLVKNNEHPPFRQWIDDRTSIPPAPAELLADLSRDLERYYPGWNEIELMMHFIAPLLRSIYFEGKNYGTFFHRKFQVEIDGKPLGGMVDALVATGVYDPIEPFFFLNEYKRSQGYTADAQGQLLAAMVAAQHLNPSPRIVYGSFVIGCIWQFVMLDGTTVSFGHRYDLLDPRELETVWAILYRTKQIIEAEVQALDLAETV